MRVISGAECTLSGGEITGNEVYGAVVEHSHSRMDATDVQFEHNGGSGVCASLMATVEMTSCRVAHNKVAGVHVAVRSMPCCGR